MNLIDKFQTAFEKLQKKYEVGSGKIVKKCKCVLGNCDLRRNLIKS